MRFPGSRPLAALVVALVLCLLPAARPVTRAQAPSPVPPDLAPLVAELAAVRTPDARDAVLDREQARLGEPLRLALQNAGLFATRQPDDEAALALFAAAQRVAEREQNLVGAGNALLNSAMVYGRRGDLDESIRALEHVTDLAGQTGSNDLLATSLNDFGIVYRLRGDLDLSVEAYQKGLAIAESAGEKGTVAKLWNNIGNVFIQQGRYREALDYLVRSLALKRELRSDDVGGTLLNIGNVYMAQGDADMALRYYREARTIDEQSNRPTGLPTNLNMTGLALFRLNRFDEAEGQFKEAQALAEAQGQRPAAAYALYDLAQMFAWIKRYADGRTYADQALAASEAVGNKPLVAETLLVRAGVRTIEGDLAGAEADATRALQLATEAGLPTVLLGAESQLGEIDRARGRLADARTHYEKATTYADSLIGQVAGSELDVARSLDEYIEAFQGLVRTELDAGDARAALAAAERSRARVLLETLTHGRQPITKAMTPGEVAHERDLRRTEASLSARLAAARARRNTPPEAVLAMSEAVETARIDLSRFRSQVFAAHPDLPVYRGELKPLADDQLAQLVPAASTVAVEFAVLPERTVVFVITHEGSGTAAGPRVHTYSVPITREALTEQASAFRSRIAARDLGVRQPARDLYRLLLEPAEPWLAGADTVVMLPDGPLWELPFQAFETPRGKYLIEERTLSYAPSLAVLREMRRIGQGRATSGSRALFSLGSSGTGSPVVDAAANRASGALPPLVEAERQARAVAAVYPVAQQTTLVGTTADAAHLRAGAAGHRIVHVAAHSVLDDSSPLESYLVLSPGSTPASSLVTAGSLMDLSLDADLVVLSGCETARGSAGGGEGLIGMTWALFVAGAPSAVVSQWAVGASSTTELMREFHRRLRAELSRDGRVRGRAASLRQASLAMLRGGTYAHPYYWAPFVVMGDGS